MAPEVSALVGSLVGVFIASGFHLVNNWITKRSDERRQFRELVINSAIANWQGISDRLLALRQQGVNVTFYPLDVFIIYMTRVCDTCLDPKMSEDALVTKMKDAGDLLEHLIAERTKEQTRLS